MTLATLASWLAPAPLLAATLLLAGCGLVVWRSGRLLAALALGAFASFSAFAAAAPLAADQIEHLVARAEAQAQRQSPAAAALVESASRRHEAHLEAARALSDGAPARLVQGFAMLGDGDLVAAGATLPAAEPGRGAGVVYVAVSFSMPPQDLRRLGREAQAAGAVVVIQGLVDGSFKKTLAAARQVFDESSVGGVAIDPNVFRAFAIRAVPTFVASAAPVQPCARGLECVPDAPPHDRVAGNITLAEALRIMKGGDQAGEIAGAAADRLEP